MSPLDRQHFRIVVALALRKLPKAIRAALFDRSPMVRDPALDALTEVIANDIGRAFDVVRKEGMKAANRDPQPMR